MNRTEGPFAHAHVDAHGHLEVIRPEAFAPVAGKVIPATDEAGNRIGDAVVSIDGAGVTVEVTTVHAAFDDDEENVGTHDLVKDLSFRGYAVVDVAVLEAALSALRSRLASAGTQLDTLAAESRSAGYPELAGELERIAGVTRHG